MVNVQSKPSVGEALKDTFVGLSELVQAFGANSSVFNKRNIKYGAISGVAVIGALVGLSKYWKFKRGINKELDQQAKDKKSVKANIDMQFLGRLKLLISIVVPSIK